jgi:hypothetical protein
MTGGVLFLTGYLMRKVSVLEKTISEREMIIDTLIAMQVHNKYKGEPYNVE